LTGVLPRTPFEEFTALPQTPRWFKGNLLIRGGEGERRGREGDAPLMQIPGFAFGM